MSTALQFDDKLYKRANMFIDFNTNKSIGIFQHHTMIDIYLHFVYIPMYINLKGNSLYYFLRQIMIE